MQMVESEDGTRIAYEEFGDGPPLLLLHGGSATRHSWNAVRPHLSDDFTLVVPDRRGRGASGDGREYSLDREVGDARALVDAIDGDVSIFGHSFGGLVAFAAASETEVDRLVLYEPSILVGEHRNDDLATRMRETFETDGREAAMKLFYREGAGIPDPERMPIWPDEIHFDLLETVIRENAAVESYDVPTTVEVDNPTLLLTGERGPAHLRDAVRKLDGLLSQSHLEELDGVGHVGIQSAPDRVATAVRTFWRETEHD